MSEAEQRVVRREDARIARIPQPYKRGQARLRAREDRERAIRSEEAMLDRLPAIEERVTDLPREMVTWLARLKDESKREWSEQYCRYLLDMGPAPEANDHKYQRAAARADNLFAHLIGREL